MYFFNPLNVKVRSQKYGSRVHKLLRSCVRLQRAVYATRITLVSEMLPREHGGLVSVWACLICLRRFCQSGGRTSERQQSHSVMTAISQETTVTKLT